MKTKLLFIIFSLLTIHYSLFAKESIFPLVESREDFNSSKDFYISDDYFMATAISLDENYIISSANKKILVWDRKKGVITKVLERHKEDVTSIAISPINEYIVSASKDKTIKVWDRKKNKLLKTFKGHKSFINSIAISRDENYIVSGSGEYASKDNSVMLWNMKTGKLLKTFKGHKKTVNTVTISLDNKYLISGSDDKTIKIWDKVTGGLIKTLKGHESSINSIVLSKDAKYVISGSDDKTIKIWDRATGGLIKTLKGHKSSINSIVLSKDAKYVISGSDDKTIKIWDRVTGELLKTLEGHTGSVNSISSSGNYIVSSSFDEVNLWGVNKMKLVKTFETHEKHINSIAISSDKKYIISGSGDIINIWDREEETVTEIFEKSIKDIVISPNDKYFVIASDESIKIFNIKGKLIKTLEGHESSVWSISISNDSNYIASGSLDETIKLWNFKTGELLRTFEGHEDIINKVIISPNNKYIISCSDDNIIKMWDIEKGTFIKNIGKHGGVTYLDLSNDGKYLVSGSDSMGSQIGLWDIQKSTLIKKISNGNSLNLIGGIAISPDGKFIATSTLHGTIEYWDIKQSTIVKVLKGYRMSGKLAITNDGNNIVLGSQFGRISYWDIESGKELKKFIAGKNGNYVVFNNSTKKMKRVDDRTFLLKKREIYRDGDNSINEISPIYPSDYNLSKQDQLELSITHNKKEILNNNSMELNLSIKNKADNSYFIYIQGESNYLMVELQRVGKIAKGETKELVLKVHAKLPRNNPKPVWDECNITVVTGNGSRFSKTVPIYIGYAEIVVQKAELSEDGKTLNIELKNQGTYKVAKAKVKLLKPFDNNTTQEIVNLEANSTITLPFDTKGFAVEANSTLALWVAVDNEEEILKNPSGIQIAPAYVWRVGDGVSIVLHKMAWYVYALWVMTALVLLWLIWYFKHYRNSLVLQLQKEPKSLLTLSPVLLVEAKKKLAKINELETILKTLGITQSQLDEAIDFDKQKNRAELFAKRIPHSYLVQEGKQQKLACQKTELSVDDFLLCFTGESAVEIAEQFKEDGNRVFVVGAEEEREAIAKLARDKTNNIIAPTQAQWSEFLLSPKSQEVLMKILAECLEFSSISPYQTSKGVNKEVDFFGRIKIVRDMKMNSNRNYMIVGGRQLGKSSILKKLERAYTQSTSVDCRFINLEGKKGNIVLAMAQSFGLESGASLEDVYNYIYQSDKKMLLLIDEVDEFIEPEIKCDYETLKTLKNLAEEGKATFVFAGYWTLYQYVVADYLSPLYNFGELIVLEGLEKEACRELMIKPMQRIGLKHEEVKYLDEVIEACGQRANLIATICDEVLKEHKGKVIQKTELKKAMQSSSVRDKLLGWDNMDALDKVIIYLTIEKSTFEFDEVLSLLEEEGIEVEASVVKKSLERLVIAYILKREEEVFSYRVPLMKESVLKTNEKGRRALLDELVGNF